MKIVVLGAGICGLASALLLARDGHEITVLERDEQAPPHAPHDAWDAWARDGVKQFRQAHYLTPAGRIALEEMLPDVADAFAAAGAVRFDLLRFMPPSIADREPRDGDERFVPLPGRRPTLESVVARIARDEDGMEI